MSEGETLLHLGLCSVFKTLFPHLHFAAAQSLTIKVKLYYDPLHVSIEQTCEQEILHTIQIYSCIYLSHL